MSESLSIYIHVPFCVRKCGYCDFFSVTDLSGIDAYVAALLREIELRSEAPRKHVASVYFGGGTPSVLPAHRIDRILSSIGQGFDLSTGTEITLELNPGTADAGYFADLKKTGINRLSIGVQSFFDEKLKFLGRIHTAQQAVTAIDDARASGFENIGLDLIYGLPEESPPAWERDLKQALSFSPEHLSCYMLTLEKGTPLHLKAVKKQFAPRSQEALATFFQATSMMLTQNGFIHYEISNFARNETFFSRHNSRYWQRAPYLGMGPGAHSFDGKVRSWNAPDLQQYIDDIKAGRLSAEQEILDRDQAMLETVMLSLRTAQGLDIRSFEREFGIKFEEKFNAVLTEIGEMRLGEVQNGRFRLNLEGFSCLNSILEGFANPIFPD